MNWARSDRSWPWARRVRVGRLFVLVVLLTSSIWTGGLRAQAIDDFDQRSLGEVWTALGKTTTARRTAVPEGVDQAGVAGHYVEFTMDPGGRLVTRAETALPPAQGMTAIRFMIQADTATVDKPAELEVQFFCGQRKAWRWCKFQLSDTNWHAVELPLRYFRHSSGAYVEWSEVTRVGWMARKSGSFRMDDIQFLRDDQGTTATLTPEELGRIAFGDRAQLHSSRHFSIVTNQPDLAHEAILEMLERLYDQVANDFPELTPLRSTVPVMIFDDDEDYQGFFAKLEPRIRSTINRPTTPGYTLFGVACCVFSDEFGPVRPIYVHEACHALFARRLGLGNQGEWLHEGLANHYQTTLLGQDRLEPARYVMSAPVSWKMLLSGEGVPLNHYAHVMFFVEWMMADSARSEVLGVAMKQMREETSTRFDELVVQLLQKPEAELQASYKAYVESVAASAR